MDRRYITPNEFAALFGISRRTVYRHIDEIKSGVRDREDLPFVQFGGKKGAIRIDIHRYIRNNSLSLDI